ncbi:MAG: hypothetical protein ACI8RZ_003575, partial [Myxococcota bacterium]
MWASALLLLCIAETTGGRLGAGMILAGVTAVVLALGRTRW